MGRKRTPSPPPAPDPRATAQAQAEFNVDAARTNARLNRVDQNTTQGTVRFNDMGNDRWESTTTLSPEQQRLYDLSTQAQTTYGEAANSQLGQAREALSSPFAFNAPDMRFDVADRTGGMTMGVQDRTGELQRGLQDRSGSLAFRPDFEGVGDPNQSRDAVEAALMARLNPQLERDRAALENRLANQGITMGSEAFNTGMSEFGRNANDARIGAILNAGQEQSRMFGLGMGQAGLRNAATQQAFGMDMGRGQFANDATNQAFGQDIGRGQFNNAALQQAFGMDMGRAQFGNQARQQSLQEQLALRAQPVNEASALLSGSQVQMPQFQNVPQVQVGAPDYAGAVGQNQAAAMQQWNARVQQQGQTQGQIGQLAGTAAMAGMMYF